MRPPDGLRIPVPEFPASLEWLSIPAEQVDELLGGRALLVEFWDFARINSLRTLPYLSAWHERYAGAGLAIVGAHSPGYSCSRGREAVAAAVERLGIEYPVVLDPELDLWRIYGNRGWPGRYLFDRAGVLVDVHYGEGEYEPAELAIQAALREIDPDFAGPAPLEPIRPEDAPGVRMEPQTADVALPAERGRLELVLDWTEGEDYIESADAGAAASVNFEAGSAWAVLSGNEIEPGPYETDGTVVADSPGLRLHGFQFTPAPPAG